ncbi:hypothetical protein ACFV1L_05965 [Kitasatospora sp. NPDC059646]|uniref:hypothetical protein n=1 Tax=Kitasatospora sp. NPDC059646 TaxID=3346893 RepID=UPI0036CEB2AC
MTTIVRGVVLVVAVAVAYALGFALDKGTGTTDGDPASVVQFNSGFRDAKQDDCEQGFRLACEWLESAK